MTPEDLALLQSCYSRKNHHRRSVRTDASMGFNRLNKKYGKPVVDAALEEIKNRRDGK